MKREVNVDQVLDSWFTEGPTHMPDRTVAAIAEQLDDVHQRGPFGFPGRLRMPRFVPALAGAAIVLVVAVVAMGVYFNGPGVGVKPSPTPSPSPSAADPAITAMLNNFLDARVAGNGAQQYLNGAEEDIPLLYATTSEAPYERAEFERVLGIEWPYGWIAFKVRLFAGDTVVEQLFFTPTDGPLGLEYQPDGFGADIAPSTENGLPVAVPAEFFDGEVTLHAAHPWVYHASTWRPFRLIPVGPGVGPTTDGGQRTDWDYLDLVADPSLVGGAGCQADPNIADAAALAESIRSYPGVKATAPMAVSAGRAEGLMMDVVIAAGRSITVPTNEQGDPCDGGLLYPLFDVGETTYVDNGVATGQATGDWMRLYLFDVPEGSSMRILAIAIIAPESTFERAVDAAMPIVDSIEFHAP